MDRKGSGEASEEPRLVNFLAGVFDHTVDMDVEVMFGEKQLDDCVMVNFACDDGTMDHEP